MSQLLVKVLRYVRYKKLPSYASSANFFSLLPSHSHPSFILTVYAKMEEWPLSSASKSGSCEHSGEDPLLQLASAVECKVEVLRPSMRGALSNKSWKLFAFQRLHGREWERKLCVKSACRESHGGKEKAGLASGHLQGKGVFDPFSPARACPAGTAATPAAIHPHSSIIANRQRPVSRRSFFCTNTCTRPTEPSTACMIPRPQPPVLISLLRCFLLPFFPFRRQLCSLRALSNFM